MSSSASRRCRSPADPSPCPVDLPTARRQHERALVKGRCDATHTSTIAASSMRVSTIRWAHEGQTVLAEGQRICNDCTQPVTFHRGRSANGKRKSRQPPTARATRWYCLVPSHNHERTHPRRSATHVRHAFWPPQPIPQGGVVGLGRRLVWQVHPGDRRGSRSWQWIWRIHQYHPVPREIRDGSQPGLAELPRE